MRRRHPAPVVVINPETAESLGIQDGIWVQIETPQGRIRQKAHLSTELDPRVVGVDYGWWFPEDDQKDLGGWSRSNVNILTSEGPTCSPEMGSTNLRGIQCRVEPLAQDS
ncbi:MAG: molybdopterin dinucleotide binding domain-containing protein [Thermodesulfobacteriota bacterium]